MVRNKVFDIAQRRFIEFIPDVLRQYGAWPVIVENDKILAERQQDRNKQSGKQTEGQGVLVHDRLMAPIGYSLSIKLTSEWYDHPASAGPTGIAVIADPYRSPRSINLYPFLVLEFNGLSIFGSMNLNHLNFIRKYVSSENPWANVELIFELQDFDRLHLDISFLVRVPDQLLDQSIAWPRITQK